jgi:multidrug efflux pump subunit AcrB
VISFLPLYLAPANAAEVIKPLFKVLAVSLTLSWIFALIQTTLYGSFILKEPKKIEDKDPYDKPFFNKLKGFIEKAIRFRWASIGIIVTVFFIFIFLGKFVKESFFPAINKNLFKVDLYFPQGSSIHQTEARAIEIEKWIMEQEKVQNLSVNIGSTPLRYYLASISVSARPNFVHFLVETESHEEVEDLMLLVREHIENYYPDGIPIISKFKVAPLPDAVIEICFRGPDPEVLRELSEQADEILRQEPLVEYYRNSWGEKTMVWKPRYSQQRGQIAGISMVGEYREGDQYMPIYLVAANKASYNYSNIGSTPIFNRFGESVSLDQVVEGYDIEWENPVIKRYNRQRYIAAQVDPIWGIESPEVEAKLFPVLEEKMEIPEGYTMFWDGMFFYQDMTNKAIASQLPMAMILIITILVVLFNSYKKTIVILLMLPLIMIGVNLGFLVTGQSMGFFATLGLLGLIGMVTKNAIVLIDQINIEINQNGKAPYDAVVTAAVSRAVPVGMAAATTILGMTPLLPDPMFGGMAATIMGGLLVATILTIIVLPVFYSTIYRLKKDKK